MPRRFLAIYEDKAADSERQESRASPQTTIQRIISQEGNGSNSCRNLCRRK